MAPRGETSITITFGPAATPVFGHAASYAATHADEALRVGERSVRATFRLSTDPDRYGRALDLVHMVYGWRATLMEVNGSPERPYVVRLMLGCAREVAPPGGSLPGTVPDFGLPEVPGLPPLRSRVGAGVPAPFHGEALGPGIR